MKLPTLLFALSCLAPVCADAASTKKTSNADLAFHHPTGETYRPHAGATFTRHKIVSERRTHFGANRTGSISGVYQLYNVKGREKHTTLHHSWRY